jgi:LmbE family N-acetylglucosaminyl deacetylase
MKKVAVIVAHPDDETLWAGGTILMHPEWRCKIVTLCRASDPDRAPKFSKLLTHLGAFGHMADLDDGPKQLSLPDEEVQQTVLTLIGETEFDLLITHGPWGEYIRHRRHEETSKAVLTLWQTGRVRTKELWCFAYEDGNKTYFPRAVTDAHRKFPLPQAIWRKKYRIITEIYGFRPDSWEAQTTPIVEAFWCFESPGHVPANF